LLGISQPSERVLREGVGEDTNTGGEVRAGFGLCELKFVPFAIVIGRNLEFGYWNLNLVALLLNEFKRNSRS
jgi:hypothetical protein